MHFEEHPCRALIPINDIKLRKKKFSAAERVLKKIDRLEGSIQSFEKADKELYEKWFSRVFHERIRDLEKIQDRHTKLAQFDDYIRVVSLLQKINLLEAYKFVKEEADRYEKEGFHERMRIDRARAERKERLREMVEEEQRAKFARWEAEQKENDERIRELKSLSEEELRERVSDALNGAELLRNVFNSCRCLFEFRFFIQMWELAAFEVQTEFAMEFEDERGMLFDEVLKNILHEFQTEDDWRKEEESKKEESKNDETSTEETIHEVKLSEPSPPSDEEKIKLLYRKLVRMLHPDARIQHNAGKELEPWEKAMWMKVQDAYDAQCFATLDRLHKVIMLRRKELSGFTLGEISQSADWLMREFEELDQQAKKMRRQPWWRFSSRKDFDPLLRKVARSIWHNSRRLENAITELQIRHAYLDRKSKAYEEGRAY